jgi:hypothetical protein
MSESLELVPAAADPDMNDAAKMLVLFKNGVFDASDASAKESAASSSLPADLPSDLPEYAPSSEHRERHEDGRRRSSHSSRRRHRRDHGAIRSEPRYHVNVTVHAQQINVLVCNSFNKTL